MVNARQFIISDTPYIAGKSWKSIRMQSGKHLSWESSLHIVISQYANAVLLGEAWQIDGEATPDQIVMEWPDAKRDIHEVIDIEKNWCGRYVLIIDDNIYTDAVGLLQVFYSEKYVTSSINVLCEVDQRKIKKPKLIYGLSPDFIPGKATTYSDVYRLLPSEIYNFVTREVTARALLPDGIPPYSEKHLEEFVNAFSNALKNMKRHFGDRDIWLALTGGRDSRVTMSLLEYAEIPYQTFTLEHDNISEGDIVIPKILTDKVGKSHLYIRKGKKSKVLEEEYGKHTAYMAVDQGKNFYARNQYAELLKYSSQVIILRSGIWECAVEYYFHGRKTDKLTVDDLKQVFPIMNLNSEFCDALLEWNQKIESDLLNRELTVDERLYWEIRAAGWLATGESAFDMMENIESVQMANSRFLISMMLSFAKKDRVNKVHEDRIIQYACNSISSVEYDTVYKFNKLKKIRKIPVKIQQCRLLAKYYGYRSMLRYYLKR